MLFKHLTGIDGQSEIEDVLHFPMNYDLMEAIKEATNRQGIYQRIFIISLRSIRFVAESKPKA